MKLSLILANLILATFLIAYPVQYQYDRYNIEDSKQQRTSSGKIDKDNHEEYQCLVSLLWFEARGENPRGIKYVLSVVENRKNSSRYPDTYCKVMYQPYQFSFVHERLEQGLTLDAIPQASEKEKLDFIGKLAYDAVHGNFESLLPSNVLHYTTTKVNNRWTRKKKIYTVEGNHRFYLSSH
jgi:spore germination cell wall hydrolase CwlJ-like protein